MAYIQIGTGKIKRWNLGSWLHMPRDCRFDAKKRYQAKLGLATAQLSFAFGYFYPLLGGLFYQSGIAMQAILIPVFYAFRALYEIGADAITSKTFGSDGMPVINFFGVRTLSVCVCVCLSH